VPNPPIGFGNISLPSLPGGGGDINLSPRIQMNVDFDEAYQVVNDMAKWWN